MQTFGVAAPPAAPTFVLTDRFRRQVTVKEGANGSHILEGLRIFKTGTFADSLGIVHTWTDIHLDQMVMHYRLLRDGGYLPDVPVRADHSFSVKDVVGYFTDVYRDPEDPQFLSSSIEFTEPDAFEKWDRGTWRSRSIEIGAYTTNDNMEFWPVVMGLAFVDLAAVEGLHGRQGGTSRFSLIVTDKETESTMTLAEFLAANQGKTEADWAAACTYAQWVATVNFAQACADWEKAVTYAAALEAEHPAPPAPPAPTPPPAPHQLPPQPPAPTPAPASTFRVGGVQTSDPRVVQAHIDTLENFRRDTVESSRRDFVTSLATDKKILAPQIDSLQALVQTMNPEQFDAFRASYAAAGPSQILQPQVPGGPPDPTQQQTTEDEISILEETLAQHRRIGMDEEKIKKTTTYQRLQKLKPSAS